MSHPLLPHQHAALVAVLRGPAFDGLSADEAFARLASDKNLCGLRTLSFVSAVRRDAMTKAKRGKKLLATLAVVDDATLAAFPGGVPGFPNRVGPPEDRRAWFDPAWTEARD